MRHGGLFSEWDFDSDPGYDVMFNTSYPGSESEFFKMAAQLKIRKMTRMRFKAEKGLEYIAIEFPTKTCAENNLRACFQITN